MVTTRSLSKAASLASKGDTILVENYSNHANDSPGCIHNKLPLEVLCLIFLYTLPRGTIDIPISHHSPWSLGQVCRAWRIIVHATPALWTNLNVHMSSDSKLDAFEELQFCLSRSAEAPLAISFKLNLHTPEKFRKLLLASSYRWAELTCRPEYVLYYIVLAEIPLPALRHLHIPKSYLTYMSSSTLAPSTVKLTTLSLTHLTLYTNYLDGLIPYFSFAQLTFLELSGSVFINLFDSLAQMPNLVELDMRHASIPTNSCTWDKPHPKPVELNYLSVLTINYNNLFHTKRLLDALVAPNVHLLNLHIPLQGEIYNAAFDDFAASPQPYSSSIKRLTVDGMLTSFDANVACQMVVNILHTMPGIVHIDFLHPEDPIEKMMVLLDGLENARRHDASLVPDLKRVTVGNGRAKKWFEVSA